MTVARTIHRQQHLLQLGSFVRGLRSALRNSAAPLASAEEVLQTALAGECVQCGIRLSGAELLAAFNGDSTAAPKLVRLRAGYCARHHCDSYYYTMELMDVPGVDWAKVIVEAETGGADEQREAACAEREAAEESETPKDARSWRRWAALAGIVTVLLGGWVARQCYLGGTVPWLRQPESFEVSRGEPAAGESTW